MYSLGVYVVPLAGEDHKHKYFCMADPSCRKNKAAVPRKKDDRRTVSTHHKSKHLLRVVAGVVKAGKQKQAKRNIQRSLGLGLGLDPNPYPNPNKWGIPKQSEKKLKKYRVFQIRREISAHRFFPWT